MGGGLVAVRRTEEAGKFSDWWSDFIASDYKDPYNGLFLDQKSLNFAPSFFDVIVMKHPGYNVGFWNLHEKNRQMYRDAHGRYMRKDQPLRCFHFSDHMGTLSEEYRNELDLLGMHDLNDHPWSYDYFHNGEKIWEETRDRYKEHKEFYYKFENPFAATNGDFITIRESNEHQEINKDQPRSKPKNRRRKKRILRKRNGKRKVLAGKRRKIGRTAKKATAVKAKRRIRLKRRSAVRRRQPSSGRKQSSSRSALLKK